MDKETAEYLLNKTCGDYNLIGGYFSSTRGFIWEDMKFLKKFISKGDRVLDLGCGNARLIKFFRSLKIDYNYTGVDCSAKLIKIAKKKYPGEKFFKANALSLPFKNDCFDKIFSIAVFHHIPSKELRAEFLEEAKRVLMPGGIFILMVWNLRQRRFLSYHLKYFFLRLIRKSKLDFKDIFYPWKGQDRKILTERYLHCFTKKESPLDKHKFKRELPNTNVSFIVFYST